MNAMLYCWNNPLNVCLLIEPAKFTCKLIAFNRSDMFCNNGASLLKKNKNNFEFSSNIFVKDFNWREKVRFVL